MCGEHPASLSHWQLPWGVKYDAGLLPGLPLRDAGSTPHSPHGHGEGGMSLRPQLLSAPPHGPAAPLAALPNLPAWRDKEGCLSSSGSALSLLLRQQRVTNDLKTTVAAGATQH